MLATARPSCFRVPATYGVAYANEHECMDLPRLTPLLLFFASQNSESDYNN